MALRRLVMGSVLAAAACLLAGPFLTPPNIAAQNTPPKAQEPFAAVKEVKPFPYCAIAHKGPLTDMSAVIGQLIQAMQGQNLFAWIRGTMFGVYYNSPADTAPGELIWEVGFPLAEGAAPQPPLVKKDWKYPTVAVAVHKGPYAKVGETIQKLMDWMKGQGYTAAGPVLERYLNNPMQVKPEELQTEVWIAAAKK